MGKCNCRRWENVIDVSQRRFEAYVRGGRPCMQRCGARRILEHLQIAQGPSSLESAESVTSQLVFEHLESA